MVDEGVCLLEDKWMGEKCMNKKDGFIYKKNKGFTLVELIVVLVILAILAAILVPALLGYIDKAKDSQDMLAAKNIMTAAQTKMASAYAEGGVAQSANVAVNAQNNDVSLIGTDFANDILKTADDQPYMAVVGLGDYNEYGQSSDISQRHKAYTVYFVAYWKDKNSDPIFFDGTNWTKTYPWKRTGGNVFTVKGEKIKLQFFFLTAPNKTNLSNNWNELKKKINSK